MDEQAYKAGVLLALRRKLAEGSAFHGEGSPATPIKPVVNNPVREKKPPKEIKYEA